MDELTAEREVFVQRDGGRRNLLVWLTDTGEQVSHGQYAGLSVYSFETEGRCAADKSICPYPNLDCSECPKYVI